MPNPTFLGYLTEPYLEDPYLGDTGLHSWGMEVNRIIADYPKYVGAEVQRQIVDSLHFKGMEVARTIADSPYPVGMEVERMTVDYHYKGMEVNRQVLDYPDSKGMEVNLEISGSYVTGMEVMRYITDRANVHGVEVHRSIIDLVSSMAMEIRLDKSLASWLCEELGYLQQDYLEGDYLAPGICAQMAGEVLRLIFADMPLGMEVNRVIQSSKTFGMEVLLNIVDRPSPVGMEVDRVKGVPFGMQTRMVLYNTTNLRIMVEFPSRGTSGTNWTSSSTAAGDFSPNNLNTDIVEQVWRSAGATSVVLTCDTQIPQGTPIDTAAFLNHNLTSSATIVAEGSNSPIFATIQETFVMVPTPTNAYYIAPSFPTLQSRYWRFIISDPTNPAGYLQIGTIVFGSTIIFQGECFTDNVVRRLKHFSDKVRTEGFTNVSNDRALKTSVSLDFRMLQYDRGNYKNIRSVFEFARTSLKCLWIPDPQEVTRFTVFGKLVEIPSETHRNLGPSASDTVDFNLEVDESL